ncbi:MAG: hypothetical protein U1E29_08510, partial [Coriobacteriia bacterium]|nr:hypothetical protein [Coriobacteriia bacterium]
LLIVWFMVRHRDSPRFVLSRSWLLVMVVAAVVGAATWQTNYECTRIASSLMLASGVMLTGPFLILSVGKQWHPAWSLGATAILPYASVCACAIALLYAGQVWP